MTSVNGNNHHTGYIYAGVLVYLLISGCAGNIVDQPTSFPVLQKTETVAIADEDILAVSDEMRHFVAKHTGQQNPAQKLRNLVRAVMHPGVMGFQYDGSLTLTAQQAFEQRSGNCLAFTNMFIALAREAGLKAYYQEAEVVPEWNARDDVYLLAKHINVLVRLRTKDYVVDVGRGNTGQLFEIRKRPDAYAKAQYFNNLGVDALFEGDIGRAHGYFERALSVDPKSDYIWSNLGVIYSRNDQPEQAIWAYQRALEIDKGALMAMSNLSVLYDKQGYRGKADELRVRVEAYRRKNPYYLLMLSDKALADRRYGEAIKLLRKAIKKKDDEHRLHFALAKSFYLSGDYKQAQNSYERAKELAPGAVLNSTYNKDLHELIQSNI